MHGTHCQSFWSASSTVFTQQKENKRVIYVRNRGTTRGQPAVSLSRA